MSAPVFDPEYVALAEKEQQRLCWEEIARLRADHIAAILEMSKQRKAIPEKDLQWLADLEVARALAV